MNLRCPQCHDAFDASSHESGALVCPACQALVFSDELESNHEADTVVHDPNPLNLRPGDFLEHFEILEFVGNGAFGTVYRAFDSRLVRDVAIKIPRQREKQISDRMDHVLREARIAAQLSDKNIVAIHEIGQSGQLPYIVSDFVEGMNLKEWSADKEASDICSIMEKIARTIERAHREGIIHRDIKPSNILVDDKDCPRLTDFGLAITRAAGKTGKKQVLGTPAYMAPEQAMGKSDSCEPTADIYALGITLFELLSGELPFRSGGNLLDDILSGNVTKLTEVKPESGRDLEAICNKAMSLEPSHRYKTAYDFAEDLRRYQAGAPTLAHAEARHRKMNRISLLLLALGVGIALAFIGWLISSNMNSETDSPELSATPVSSTEKLPFVEIEVSHEYAILGACRLDYESNSYLLVDPNSIERMSPTRFRLNDLRPGWYWIEAFVKNVGVQEVLRYVPDSPSEVRIHPLVEDWEYSNGIFELPSINIFNFDDSAPELEIRGQKFCRIDGGSFKKEGEKILDYAGDTRPDLMKGTNLVPSFYMAPHEVTNQQYHAVVDRSDDSRFEPYSEKYRNLPASALNAYRAARYCEMVGGRLMSYREYVFVATNAGTTKRPWGDGAERLHFSESAVGSVEFDKPREGPEIFGLCSGVSEWTLDFFTHPNMDAKLKSREMFAVFFKNQIIVGGEDYTPQVPSPNGSEPRQFLGAIFQNAQLPDHTFTNVGFRPVRSITPRIITDLDYIEYLEFGYEKLAEGAVSVSQ